MKIRLVKVPAGEFIMGSTKKQIDDVARKFPEVEKKLLDRETPQHNVYLNKYQIGKYPVTNQEFSEFVEDTDYKTTAEREKTGFVFTPEFRVVKGADWRHPHGPKTNLKGKQNHPVVQVSWFDALAFCSWLSEKIGQKYRLPTEAEWEKAARGTDARIFPWGNQWRSKLCNAEYILKDTSEVDRFSPKLDSPYGCSDMAGNVFEWTSTSLGTEKPWPAKFKYPYKVDDGREDLKDDRSRRIGRGGSYSRGQVYSRTTFRFADPPYDRYSTQGFRVVCEV